MTHEDVHANALEFVLGTLPDGKRRAVVAHLSGCPACRAEVASVSQVCDALGRSVDPVAPPAALRDRVLAIPHSARATTEVRSTMRASVMPWWLAAAASLVAVVAVWQLVSSQTELGALRTRVAELQAEAGDLLVARASLQEQVSTMTHQTQVLRASDLITYSLEARDGTKGAHARAYVSHKDGMVFTAEGLPSVPTGKVYQLWVIVNAKPVSVGVFMPDASGRVHAVMDTPSIPVMPGAVAVTIEPEGGLPAPSGAVVMSGLALN
jgi:anti-sigma-K factor RskA